MTDVLLEKAPYMAKLPKKHKKWKSEHVHKDLTLTMILAAWDQNSETTNGQSTYEIPRLVPWLGIWLAKAQLLDRSP